MPDHKESPEPGSYDPDHPYLPVFPADESQPDPSWHYLQLWGRLGIIKRQAQQIEMLQMEAAEFQNSALDETVRQHLRQVTAQSGAMMGLLD